MEEITFSLNCKNKIFYHHFYYGTDTLINTDNSKPCHMLNDTFKTGKSFLNHAIFYTAVHISMLEMSNVLNHRYTWSDNCKTGILCSPSRCE